MTCQSKPNDSTAVSEAPAEPVIRMPNKRHLAITESSAEDRERFWSFVSNEPHEKGCHLWTGRLDPKGYGFFNVGGRDVFAHRFAFFVSFGHINADLFACHSCDNPQCVNPDRIFLGTTTENMRDAVSKGRFKGQQQRFCKRGHEFTPENTITKRKRPGQRECLLCQQFHERKRFKKWEHLNLLK